MTTNIWGIAVLISMAIMISVLRDRCLYAMSRRPIYFCGAT